MAEKENYPKKIKELHQKAWGNYDYLEKALSICKVAYQNGDRSPLFINNYATVLLDLHQNDKALALLKLYEPMFSEYSKNYAIAIALTSYDLELIRKYNKLSAKLPKQKDAIVAYIDWQGF